MDVIKDEVLPWLARMKAAGAVEIDHIVRFDDSSDRLVAVRREKLVMPGGTAYGERNRRVGELVIPESSLPPGVGLTRLLGVDVGQVGRVLTEILNSEAVANWTGEVARAAEPEAASWAEGW